MKKGLYSVCPWTHVKHQILYVWDILIGVVVIYARGPTLLKKIRANQNESNL